MSKHIILDREEAKAALYAWDKAREEESGDDEMDAASGMAEIIAQALNETDDTRLVLNLDAATARTLAGQWATAAWEKDENDMKRIGGTMSVLLEEASIGASASPEPEPEPEVKEDAAETITIVAIGSFDWRNPQAVLGPISDFRNQHAGARLRIITSGATRGPEAVIAQVAEQLQLEHVVMSDAEVCKGISDETLKVSRVFAFIRDYSAGAEDALRSIEQQDPSIERILYREEPLAAPGSDR